MTDWVTRNMQEKAANPIKWANNEGPAEPILKPRRGVGRPVGSHTKWKSPQQRELDRAWKELHTRSYEDVEKWPGPFQKRTDFPSVRPAYWLNCPVCNGLFLSNISETRTPNYSRVSGKRATARYCSQSCAGNSKAKPIFRVCSYCAKTFRVFQNNYNKRTCCAECTSSVSSEMHTRIKAMPLIAYAFEHGVEADYFKLLCDTCGMKQKVSYTGDPGKGNRHFKVRIAEVNGKYMARCKNCYQRAANAKKAIEKALTPPERLRRYEAQKLLDQLK